MCTHYLMHAPGMGRTEMEPTAAFGAAVWLALQAPKVKNLALHQLDPLILQPQAARCDVLVASREDAGAWTPRAWLAYAHLDAGHERDHVRDPSRPLPAQAWHSGDRLWILHLVAPHRYSRELHGIVCQLFAGRSMRSLSPASHRRGQRIVVWRGTGCSATEASHYWRSRPILA